MINFAGSIIIINSINIRLSRSLYILNSVTNMLPNFILRRIYYTMVQPYLTYGIILWDLRINRT